MDFLISLIPGGQSTAIATAVAAFLAFLYSVFRAGIKNERAKSERARADNLEDELEMNREGHDIDQRIRDLSDDEARKEGQQWVKR